MTLNFTWPLPTIPNSFAAAGDNANFIFCQFNELPALSKTLSTTLLSFTKDVTSISELQGIS